MKSLQVRILAILLGMELFTKALTSPTSMNTPDFQSEWLTLKAQSMNFAGLDVDHWLGEMPLLVEVQVKVIDGENEGYTFPAIGTCARDDDLPEMYGGVCYIYDEYQVGVFAPLGRNNNDYGSAVYTGDGIHYAGLNYQTSYEVQVRVRAWLAANLPVADFYVTGIPVLAGSTDINDVFIERSHGFGEYPAQVLVRTHLIGGRHDGFYSDSVGSTIFTPYLNFIAHPYVVHGFNHETVRVWVSTHPMAKVFSMNDGYSKTGTAPLGLVEIYAWKEETLSSLTSSIGHVGVSHGTTHVAYDGFTLSDLAFLKVWAEALTGVNAGYRFPAGGTIAFSSVTSDATCSYGGLVYSYSDTSVRFWWPTGVNKGGVICVADHMANGTKSQMEVDAAFHVNYWPLLHAMGEFQEVIPTCVVE